MFFNDPEDVESQDSKTGHENLFEAEYEWLKEEHRIAASRDLIITGPTCLSTVTNPESSDSDSESNEDSDEEQDDPRQELPDGLWLMDTGSGHDLTTPSGAEGFDMQKVRRIVFSTANGRISTDSALNLLSDLLRGFATPYFLPETSWVLSIGKRVMQMGI